MRITNIQRMSLDDGPGIRTTVFVKGCPLRCKWCHNPECIDVSESEAFLQNFPDSFEFDGNTEAFCDLILKDSDFFEKSGGGITFSGGEPLLYADIIAGLLKEVKKRGYSTAVDTCGAVMWTQFEKVLPYTDLFLFDLKAGSPKVHKALTGMENGLIWDNFFRLLSEDVRIWIRIPSIGNANDSELNRIAERIPSSSKIGRVEFLPYHKYGISKYQKLGIRYEGETFAEPADETVEAAAGILSGKQIPSCHFSQFHVK